jgi:hypothetical protein
MNPAESQPFTTPLIVTNRSFPRTSHLPVQSPKYWVKEKDRYLRQLLIEDIQELTQRELVVYFTNEGVIDFRDADDISEILDDCQTQDIDLLLQTPGGIIDACEKVISILKLRLNTYRVLIPSWAKSAGTIIALASDEIVMGVNSELGPIDPQFNGIPAEFIRDDPSQQYPIRQIAESAIARTRKLANQVLRQGMLKGEPHSKISTLVDQISSAQSYSSHGAVINAEEVKSMGLNVSFLPAKDELWKRMWLLYCMYDYDCQRNAYAKVFEGPRVSIARPLPPASEEG